MTGGEQLDKCLKGLRGRDLRARPSMGCLQAFASYFAMIFFVCHASYSDSGLCHGLSSIVCRDCCVLPLSACPGGEDGDGLWLFLLICASLCGPKDLQS